MSRQTMEDLSRFTRIGYAAERGNAWHYRKTDTNHFPYEVPETEADEMFSWEPTVLPLTYPHAGQDHGSDRVLLVHPNTGDLLGVFKNGYVVHPYKEWLVDKVRPLVNGDLKIGSLGLLDQGAKAWVQVEIPETIKVPEVGEAFRASLIACTSLDGTIATTYKRVATRVVCDNTLGAALAERGRKTVKVKHTKDSRGRLDLLTAQDALGLVNALAEEIAASMAELANTKVTGRQWDAFLKVHFGEQPKDKGRSQTIYTNKIEKIEALYKSDPMVAPWKGTAWGVSQAISTYNQQMATVRNTARPFRNMLNTIKVDRSGLSQIDRDDAEVLANLELVLAK